MGDKFNVNKRRALFGKIALLYKNWSLIAFNAIVFFVLINMVFYFIPNPIERKIRFHQSLYKSPNQMLDNDTNFLKQVYPDLTINEVKLRMNAPDVKSHPVLAFMNVPTYDSCYRIGVENIRYDSFNTSGKEAKEYLNNNVWVLGGSTTFGRGVCSDETIPYYLNLLDTANHYVNLGCQGYTQWCELEKLILLLRKGYRPKTVIFIDGLNDLIALSRYNFDALETPGRNQHAYSMEFGPDQVTSNSKNIYSIPAINWWYSYLATRCKDGDLPVTENIYAVNAPYNTAGYIHYLKQKTYLNLPGPELKEKMIRYYRANLDLMQQLASAYNFNYKVIFQPIGLLYRGNIFIKDQKQFDSAFFAVKQTSFLQKAICEEIRRLTLPGYVDATQLDRQCKQPYVDLTHYSAAFHLAMAKKIIEPAQNTATPED